MATDILNSTNAHRLNHTSAVDMSTTLTINQAGTGEPLRVESNSEAWKTMFVSNDAGTSPSFDERIKFAQIAEDQDDVDNIVQGNRRFSNREIVNTWLPAAHLQSTPNQPSINLAGIWGLNANNNIVPSIDTGSHLMYISDLKYENYLLEATFFDDGNNADDDMASVVLAFYVDPVTNIQHTLTLLRAPRGIGPVPAQQNTLIVNETPGTVGCDPVNGVVISSLNGGVWTGTRWALLYNLGHCQGRVDSERTRMLVNQSANIPAENNGWNAYPNGCRIRVKRIGDSFECSTTAMNTTTPYLNAANQVINFNLADFPNLEKFRGPQSFGIGNLSQPNLAFQLTTFRDLSPIYNLQDNSRYTWNDATETWTRTLNTPLIEDFSNNTFVCDQYTKKTYYVSSSNPQIQLRSPVTMRQNPATGLIDVAPGMDLIMTSPNGTRYAVRVDNNGNVTTTAI